MANSKDCAVCKLIRFYLLLAVPLIAVLGFGSLDSQNPSESPIWFARVELIDMMAWMSASALALVLVYRIYTDIWVPKKREKAIKRLLHQDIDGDL